MRCNATFDFLILLGLTPGDFTLSNAKQFFKTSTVQLNVDLKIQPCKQARALAPSC
jgi:hypothetical protein